MTKVSIPDLMDARGVLIDKSLDDATEEDVRLQEPLGRVADWLSEVIERMKEHQR